MEIKPIETAYKGYKFRSRLEARWAVFFDTAGIKYEYESEGYETESGGRYLPDFYLPDFDLHVEVKRDTNDGIDEVMEKCEKAIQWGGAIKQILILSDVPEGKSIDGGLWHFPVIFWAGVQVSWGWSFFHDIYDENNNSCGSTWQISGAAYPYSRWWVIKNKTIKYVSDYELRKNHFLWKEVLEYRKMKGRDNILTLEEDIHFQQVINRQTFNAFAKARSARFEFNK